MARYTMPCRRLVAAVCAVAAVVSVRATSAYTVVVDQANLVSDGNLSVDLAHPVGQTFTTGVGGDLVGIEVAPLLGRTTSGVTIHLDVYRGTTLLGTVSRTTTGFPPGSGVVPYPLDAGTVGPGYFDLTPLGVTVAPGDALGFIVRHSQSGICDLITNRCTVGRVGALCQSNAQCHAEIRVGVNADGYASGQAITSGAPDPLFDLAFKTFVCAMPFTADHYLFYRTRTMQGAARFARVGPVTLADEFGSAEYEVVRPVMLGLPAGKNGKGILAAISPGRAHERVSPFAPP